MLVEVPLKMYICFMLEASNSQNPYPGSDIYDKALRDILRRSQENALREVGNFFDTQDSKDRIVTEACYAHVCRGLDIESTEDGLRSFRIGAAAATLIFAEFIQKTNTPNATTSEEKLIQIRSLFESMPQLAEQRVMECGSKVNEWLGDVAVRSLADPYTVKLGAGFVMALKTAAEYRRRAAAEADSGHCDFSEVEAWLNET